jgi:predicted enzyme related to lactoylglutathione lyase
LRLITVYIYTAIVTGSSTGSGYEIVEIFINVESIEDYINKAKQLGARVVKDRQEISEGLCSIRRLIEKYN